jgi:hypothetical protein
VKVAIEHNLTLTFDFDFTMRGELVRIVTLPFPSFLMNIYVVFGNLFFLILVLVN